MSPIQSITSAAFGQGGQAGRLLQAQDWSRSPLGEPARWPQALTILVRVMLNSGQPMFIAWGPQRILLYNDGYSSMLGARHPAAFARPFFETWPEVLDEVGGLMDKVFLGEPVHMDDLVLTLYRNGFPEETHFSFSYTPVPDDHGTITGLFCACTETTGRVTHERREAADAKRERDRLFEMSRDLFGVATVDGYLKSINPAWSKHLGRPMDELLARPFSEIIHPDDLALTGDVVARLQAGEAVHQFHVRLLKADGTPISFAWSAVPESDLERGHFYTVGRDISEDIRREEALRQSQKMEAVGQLTGGLAHDFNNLLQAAHGCLDLILRTPDNPERITRLASNGLQATERGAKLTAQLLAFSRAQKIELSAVDVGALIFGMAEILQSSVGPLIKIISKTGRSGLGVMSDSTQLEMAILNLAINARDAMPEGGEMVIAVSECTVLGDPDLPDGNYVAISLSDTGGGMSSAVAARAFEPFFSTKGVGRGTGLGLSQVYATARQAKGTARIEPNEPTGTCVVMWLPQIDIACEAAAAREGTYVGGSYEGKTVLVVDDDSEVRLFLAASLEGLGFRVVTAHDAESGLSALSNLAPDLLLLDFAMPRMNGAQMAEIVRAQNPVIPIIFASGYSETAAIERAVGESAMLLKKPFSVSELERAVSTALNKYQ